MGCSFLFSFIVAKGKLRPMAMGQGKVGGVWSEDVLTEVSDSNRAPKPHNLMIPLHNMATHTKIPCFPGCLWDFILVLCHLL